MPKSNFSSKDIKYMINESIKILLNESSIDKFVKNRIKSNLPQYLQPYLDIKISELGEANPEMFRDMLQQNPNMANSIEKNPNETLLMYIRREFINEFEYVKYIKDQQAMKNIIDIIFGELHYVTEKQDDQSIARVKDILQILSTRGELESSLSQGTINYDSLESIFGEELNQQRKNFKELNKTWKPEKESDYTVIPINSFEEASEYAEYCSWCVTKRDSYYRDYAKFGQRFYFCLKHGFNNLVEEEGENCPLDEYGLSMISVLIDCDGEPIRVTTRWNHEHRGENNPKLITKAQIQNVIQQNFDTTFIPYSDEELKQMNIIPFRKVQSMLDNGVKYDDIFDFYSDEMFSNLNNALNFTGQPLTTPDSPWYLVSLNDQYNILKDNKILCKKWFEYIGEYQEDIILENKVFLAQVSKDEKWNFIDIYGNLLSPIWFDGQVPFSNGYAVVELNNKCNILNMEGNLVSKEWFEGIGYVFDNGICIVYNFTGDKDEDGYLIKAYNYFDVKKRELLSPNRWFNDIKGFSRNGYGWVRLGNEWMRLFSDGKLISSDFSKRI